MLFNSYAFILLFLPATVAGYFALGHLGQRKAALVWLLAASLFFYAYWNPIYLALLVASMAFNYALGLWIAQLHARGDERLAIVLGVGVAVNLLAIAYFKYAMFLAGVASGLTGLELDAGTIILPLAISFYTFQQIAYLVDASRGETREHSFLQYCIFVAFFPQLIAGPIVHHKEVLPQFADPGKYRLNHDDIAFGITLFTIGLLKKVLLADNIAPYSTAVFDAAAQGAEPSLIEAWGGALAYTLQLYFDFSGYSDMAVGLGRIFGIRLPINFNSPYKAVNIIDFWRRWHITLSRFLRDYLYVGLGGNRRGPTRRYLNLFITMLLGGLWHGAGWTFVAWGALHGFYLAVNHAWHMLRRSIGLPPGEPTRWGRALGCAATLLAVIVGWVFFRAASLDAALIMLRGMAGLNGIVLPAAYEAQLEVAIPLLDAIGASFGKLTYFEGSTQILWTVALFAVALVGPSSNEIMGYAAAEFQRVWILPWLRRWLAWTPSRGWAAVTAAAFLYTLTQMSQISEFLYFQF